jgi:hypothetical protein
LNLCSVIRQPEKRFSGTAKLCGGLTQRPTMLETQLTAAIPAASLDQCDHIARLIWKAHGAGAIDDIQAQRLAEMLEERRRPAREERKPVGIPLGRASIFPPRRLQRSPDRARSIERRRTLAASGPMPPALACGFTTSELAVLRIVSDEVRDNGQCVLPIDAIAARAGTCRTTAQNAIREAARQGLLTIQERRREGRRNAPNVLRIISREWLAWIKRGGGFKKNSPTDNRFGLAGKSAAPQRPDTGASPRGGPRSTRHTRC